MNRIRIAALAGLLLLAAGCSAPPEEAEDGYQVYYSALEDRYAQQALASEPYGSAPPEEPIPDLVAALLDGPDSPGLTSPSPTGCACWAGSWRMGCSTWICPSSTAACQG